MRGIARATATCRYAVHPLRSTNRPSAVVLLYNIKLLPGAALYRLDQDGKFTDATYQSLLKLLGWLMEEYNLDVSDVKRHYDAGGKLCPLYYAEHEDAWEQLKQDLSDYISGEKV